jgi:hypothetical protein
MENTVMNLGSRMVLRLTIGLILVADLLFIPAGTLRYWQGWCYLPLFNGKLNKLTLTN